MKTIREIILAAGGALRLAEASKETRKPVDADAIWKWAKHGIPAWHWPLVMARAGVSESDIFAANQMLIEDPPSADAGRRVRRRSSPHAATGS